METAQLLHEKNYFSHVPHEIFNRIFVNLDRESNMNLCFVSTKFYNRIHEYVPPPPISMLYSTSNQVINYINKLEHCKSKYGELGMYCDCQNLHDIVPKYADYVNALETLPNAKRAVACSIYFCNHNGHKRINELCEEDAETRVGWQPCCASYFRDPYTLLATIILLLCLTVSLGGIITHNIVTSNETARELEEDRAHSAAWTNNLRLVQSGQYSDPNAPNYMIRSGTFPGRSRQNCYKSLQSYENDATICFMSFDELCSARTISEKYLEYLLARYSGQYSAKEIRDIYGRLVNYVCEHGRVVPDAILTEHSAIEQIDVFKIGPSTIRNCMLPDGSLKWRPASIYKAFYVTTYKINAICIADDITIRPDLSKPIWPFIVSIVVAWVAFLTCACIAIIIV